MSVADTSYKHPTRLGRTVAKRLAQRCVEDGQNFALVQSKEKPGKWIAFCPIEDTERFKVLVEEAGEM